MRCSIIIPVYNKARFLGASLRSVLDQDFTDFEVVVVDDGSTDGSGEMVRALADPRVRLVTQPNGGVSRARNAGILLAQGELVFFFDADDWMHPQFVSIQLAQAERHPAVAFFAARFLRFEALAEVPQPWPLTEPVPMRLVDDLPAVWRSGQTFITSSVAVRRQTLLAMQPCFPPDESKGEDMDLWFRLAEAGPLCLTDMPLVGYREDAPGSLTQQHAAMVFPPYLERMHQRARSGAMRPALARSTLRFVSEARISQARALLVRGRRWQAVKSLCLATPSAGRPRWWMSWLMALSLPGQVVQCWERKRIRRTQARL